MKPGDLVWLDADTEEWGRVTGPATVIDAEEVGYFNRLTGRGVVLVDAHSIRANIFVRRGECSNAKAGN
jgi:hypothetical protein